MQVSVRQARKGEGAAILAVHRRAIHEIACADYTQDILTAWGPPIPDSEMPGKAADMDRKPEAGHILLVAEIDGRIAGFGEVVPARNELLAVYVSPDFKRSGVGSALILELERLAREKGISYLQLDASLTAEPFYARHGYQETERGWHTLRTGAKMACVKMKKALG